MPRFEITDKLIKVLQPPPSGNRIHFGDLPGFGVRISSGGAIAFVYTYRNAHGQKRLMKIGRYPSTSCTQARTKALKYQNLVENGRDPLAEKQANCDSPTFADLSREYLADPETSKKRASTMRNERQMLATIINKNLGTLLVQNITRNDIARLHASLKATPYRANRVLALLSTMFSFAMERTLRTDNPAKGVKRYPEHKREAMLTEEQLERLSTALASYPDLARDESDRLARESAANAIRLLLLTGARENEVLQAAWAEFDLGRAVWTKPSHHTKQKKTEHVALSDAALELLQSMEKKKSGEHLFPGNKTEKDKTEKARATIRRPWVQVLKAAGLAERIEKEGKRLVRDASGKLVRRKIIQYKPVFRIHDLRHNFASHLVSRGVSLHIVGKLLGHTQPQTTARYAHLSDSPLRDAANQFGLIVTRGGKISAQSTR
ncbi:MAG: site-specific integrase [Terriglobia bacterium]|nr:site-specific integrase [Terriglobia bacterium]